MTRKIDNEVIDLQIVRNQRSAQSMAHEDARLDSAEDQLMQLGDKAREIADRIAKVRAAARALSR